MPVKGDQAHLVFSWDSVMTAGEAGSITVSDPIWPGEIFPKPWLLPGARYGFTKFAGFTLVIRAMSSGEKPCFAMSQVVKAP